VQKKRLRWLARSNHAMYVLYLLCHN